MATKGLLEINLDDSAGAAEDSGDSRLPVVTSRDWREGERPKFTFWLHTGAEGSPAMDLTHRAVVRFPTRIEFERDGEQRSFLKLGKEYVLPDSVTVSLGQKRYRPKKNRGIYPYWYTDRRTKVHRFPAISPTWRLFHAIADAVFAGELDKNAVVFHWEWTDKGGAAQEMSWTAADCLGRVLLGSDADFRKGLAPRYESVVVIADHKDAAAGPKILIGPASLAGRQPDSGETPGYSARLGKIYGEVFAVQRGIDEKNEILKEAGRPTISRQDADPYHNPYPFKLEFEAEAEAASKYRLTALMADAGPGGIYEITDEIRAAIEAPIGIDDLDHVLKPGRHDFDDLYGAMRDAATAAGCEFVLDRLDELFEPWSRALADASADAPREPEFCSCGCGLEDSWSECPNCGKAAGGTEVPPVLAELAYDGGMQKCSSCGRVTRLDAGTCPQCGAELPIQVMGDLGGYDDYTTEID